MDSVIAAEIARLENMTVTKLAEKFETLIGEKCRSRNKLYLIRRIAWRLQANAEGGLSERALKQADWSRPGLVLLEHNDGLREADTGGLYHGGWAFQKLAFQKVIGYGPHNNGEDQELARRLSESGATEIDPCAFAPPFYVYRYDNASYHLSYMDDQGYRDLGNGTDRTREPIAVGWSRDWANLPIIRRFTFGPHVNPKTDRTPIELIGPVFEPGTNGPQNGMYALQKELRKRIDEGFDWLSIKPLPVSKGAIPWFWNWQDRRYAM